MQKWNHCCVWISEMFNFYIIQLIYYCHLTLSVFPAYHLSYNYGIWCMCEWHDIAYFYLWFALKDQKSFLLCLTAQGETKCITLKQWLSHFMHFCIFLYIGYCLCLFLFHMRFSWLCSVLSEFSLKVSSALCEEN